MLACGALQSVRRLAARRATLPDGASSMQGRWCGFSLVRGVRTRRVGAVHESVAHPTRGSDPASGGRTPTEENSRTVNNASDLGKVASSLKSVTLDGQTYRMTNFGVIRLDGDNRASDDPELARKVRAKSGHSAMPDKECLPPGEARDPTSLDSRPGDFFGIDAYEEAAHSGALKRWDERVPAHPAHRDASSAQREEKYGVLAELTESSYIEEQYFPAKPSGSPGNTPVADVHEQLSIALSQPEGTNRPSVSFIEQQYFGTDSVDRGSTVRALAMPYAGARGTSSSATVPGAKEENVEQLVSSRTSSDVHNKGSAVDAPRPGEFVSPTALGSEANVIDGQYFGVAAAGFPYASAAGDSDSAMSPSRDRLVGNDCSAVRQQPGKMKERGIKGASATGQRPNVDCKQTEPVLTRDPPADQSSNQTVRAAAGKSIIERLRYLSTARPEEYGSQSLAERRQSGAGIAPAAEKGLRDKGVLWADAGRRQREAGVHAHGNKYKRESVNSVTSTSSRPGLQSNLSSNPLELSPRDSRQQSATRYSRQPQANDLSQPDRRPLAEGDSGKADAAAATRQSRNLKGASSFSSEERAEFFSNGSVIDRLRNLAMGANAEQNRAEKASGARDLGTREPEMRGRQERGPAQTEKSNAEAHGSVAWKSTADISRQPVVEKAMQLAETSVTDPGNQTELEMTDSEQQAEHLGNTKDAVTTGVITEVAGNAGLPRIKAQIRDWQNETFDTVLHHLKSSVLFQSDDLLAVNKPYGIASHGGPGIHHSVAACLPQLALELKHQGDLHLAHRLDRDTTGVLLLAKTQLASVALQRMFQQRQVVKTYWALTRGVPEPKEGIIDIPIAEHSRDGSFVMTLAPDSSSAITAVTRYKVLSHHGSCALVEVEPVTGVKHQIRVHLAFGLDAAILGDHKYSHRDKLAPQRLFPDLLNQLGITQAKVRFLPMHLHARSVVLPEFDNGRNVFIVANLPKHFLQNMRKLKVAKPPSADNDE